MKIYTKESLLKLKSNIDLVEVLSDHIDMKRQGVAYKACCPFHDEKTPSFLVRKGDSNYHCFGCGAHGDAITFLMTYLQFSFVEAVESLAERFNVHLDVQDSGDYQRVDTTRIKDALEWAAQFYHFYLLHTKEGHQALEYLYKRGLDLDFIKNFRIGLAPYGSNSFRSMMYEKKISNSNLIDAGLMAKREDGSLRDFFYDRIMFPVSNASGQVIGFSGRKYKEETFGGKYINSPETLLFKKSRILFGLNYCRRRIVKERKAIVVEGQIDALRLIKAGFNITVAALGTAFGDEHVKTLKDLGIETVYLAMDSDKAGIEATQKVGHLFQKEGIEVLVVDMPDGYDPDTVLEQGGSVAFQKLLESTSGFLEFLYISIAMKYDLTSPASKTAVIGKVVKLIKEYDDRIMVHESLRKLAQIAQVPEEVVGLGAMPKASYVRKTGNIVREPVDGDKILETDLLRILFLVGNRDPEIKALIKDNIKAEDFIVETCAKLYSHYFELDEGEGSFDMLTMAINLDSSDSQEFLNQINSKKINYDKLGETTRNTIQRLLERNWKNSLEEINNKIKSGKHSEEELFEFIKEFDDIKRARPVKLNK